MTAKWQTTKRAGVACCACGKSDTCTVSPDGTAFYCFRDGKTHQTGKRVATIGTGYIGKAHRPRLENKPCINFPSADAAIRAAGKSVRGGTFAGSWVYHDASSAEVMKVARFNLTNGSKQFRPVRSTVDGWSIGDPPGPLPLYKLPELIASTIETVFVIEGEKAADAAQSVGLLATTSSHGSSAPGKSDWSPLAGRNVVILPDNDDPGRKYGCAVAEILTKLEPPVKVKIVTLPGLPKGGDIVQYVESFGDAADPDDVVAAIVALAEAAIPVGPAPASGPILVCMADVKPRRVDWLWEGRIPQGRISLIVGRPGEGKSFLTVDMASRVTTGAPWPDGSDCPTGSVILISSEDDPGDTIRPRLDAHGADPRRVHLLSAVRRIDADGKPHEVMFGLEDVFALETALIKTSDCKLIVIDPIGSFLGGRTDAHRDNEVRAVLAPVARLAEKYGVAVVIVMHRRKSAGGNADESALGSRAFTGIARAVWHLSRDPENKTRRLLLPGKNNLAVEGHGLAFTIAGDPPALSWEHEPVTMSADEAMAAENGVEAHGRPPEERDGAAEWLAGELADYHPHPVADVRRDAKNAGIAWRTVQRASKTIHLKCERSGFGGGFNWRLPRPADPSPVDATPNRATTLGHGHSGTVGTIGESIEKHGLLGGKGGAESQPCHNSLFGTNGQISLAESLLTR